MAGYKTVTSWAAPDIEFDKDGKRIFPADEEGYEVCRSPFASTDKHCVKLCGRVCAWGRSV